MAASPSDFQLQQLIELLTVVSSFTEEASATRAAIECAAATLEAEVAAVVRDGAVVASVGFPSGSVPGDDLVRVAQGRLAVLEVPGVGACWTASASLGGAGQVYLLLARSGEAGFSVAEGNLIRGMARVLMLTLRMLHTLAAERRMHRRSVRQAEENARLLHTLQLRNRLIEKLHGIRRAITRRGSLSNILELIVTGAHELLTGEAATVTLWLLDPAEPGTLTLAHSAGRARPESPFAERKPIDAAGAAGRAVLVDGPVIVVGRPWSAATAVHQAGTPVGSLMLTALAPAGAADAPPDDGPAGTRVEIADTVEIAGAADAPSDLDQQILLAFAEHVSLAISDAKTASDMQLAFHDSLTGLASRRLFLDRLRHSLTLAESEPPLIALLFIDLDHFKQINDTLGHAAGDSVLIAVAERVAACLRDADVAARLGGDEFAVMLQGVTTPEVATGIGAQIITALSRPILLPSGPIEISASIGIAFSGDGSQDLGELLRQADVAMYRAKRHGRGRHEVFTPTMEHTFAAD